MTASGPLMSVSELTELAGTYEALSPWHVITQAMIDAFAETTSDHQFIHVDPAAAARTAFGGTIAHGFLTLSMLSAMAYPIMPRTREAALGINYGFDRIRFIAPVRSGARIRSRMKLAGCERRKPEELLCRYDVEVEIEGSDRPALSARWLTMTMLQQGA